MAFLRLLALVATASAFAPASSRAAPSTALNSVPLAGGMSFDRVCREWRCKYTGDKTDSESLAAIAGVVDEYMSKIKAIDKSTTVNRLVCGSCLDFKLMITNDLDAYGPWSETDHAPEAEFIAKLKAIDGVSQVETQEITFVKM